MAYVVFMLVGLDGQRLKYLIPVSGPLNFDDSCAYSRIRRQQQSKRAGMPSRARAGTAEQAIRICRDRDHQECFSQWMLKTPHCWLFGTLLQATMAKH
jgi:hypothetical protein